MARARAYGIVAGLCAAATLLLGAPAAAQSLASLPSESRPAQALADARPIAGWSDFCRRWPLECAVDPSEPSTITLTPKIWQSVVSVNRTVNTTIRPMTDEEHWGIADHWDIPTDGAGDCEDFQLLKRKLLVGEGLPRRAMRMTVVVDERGEGHAVLILRTDRGDLVLDNKTSQIMPWYETGYRFVKRESQDRMGWVALGGVTSPTITAQN